MQLEFGNCHFKSTPNTYASDNGIKSFIGLTIRLGDWGGGEIQREGGKGLGNVEAYANICDTYSFVGFTIKSS